MAKLTKAEEINDITSILYHKYNLILTVCHTIIHMLVCALSEDRRPMGQLDLDIEGYFENDVRLDVDEAEWWWETVYLVEKVCLPGLTCVS